MLTPFPNDPAQLFASSDFASSRGISSLVVGNTLYLAIVAGNRTANIATYNGTAWTGPTQILGDWATPQSISLAYFKNQFYLTIIHTDNRIYQSVSSDGVSWSDPTQLFESQDFATPQAVAMVATANKLYMAIVAGDTRTYLASYDGTSWSGAAQILGDWATNHAMSLAYFNNKFYLTLTNTDNRIYQSVSSDGVSWSYPTQLFAGQDFATPQAINTLATPTKLYYAIVSSSNRVFVASYDGNVWSGPTQVLGDWATPMPVDINYFQDNFYLTLLRSNYRIYQAVGSPLPA